MSELREKISKEPFLTVGRVADRLNRRVYVVGGYVRDLLLDRKSKDIDFVTVGSGIELAEAIAAENKKARLTVFRNFGTAQVVIRGMELEFVGARKESYNRGSRKPIVENGTLEEDLSRRDFTINALALCVNGGECFGEIVDLFGGISDLQNGLIRTPLDPDITFSDDPLRMLRAVRFAARLGFTIVPETMDAIRRNASRLEIISRERIADELCKMMQADKPSRAWMLLSETELLPLIIPELEAMKGVETMNGRGHKDNFLHTLEVLDNVAEKSDSLWLRWAALLHDIAKPVTKRWDAKQGWTFHNHNFIGARMVPKIFRSLKLPLNDRLKYVQKLVELHMRPIALVEEKVTDSAVRRLLFDAGEDIDDLMILCEADITSKNAEKVRRLLKNFRIVREKMKDLEERDHIRTFQPPVDGHEIMAALGMKPTDPHDKLKIVGELKAYVKDAILDGHIRNDHDEARALMLSRASELGFTAVEPDKNKTEGKDKMYYVSKRIEISGSHSLELPYSSKCTQKHGHNWVITVYCRAKELNASGMVTDFTHIKENVTGVLDHADFNEVLPFNPTAENIARWIQERVENCYRVEVQESEGNTAAYEID